MSGRFERGGAPGGSPPLRGGGTAPGPSAIRALIALVLVAFPAVCHAGGTTAVSISATILSQNNCRFRSGGPPPALAFGTIDPAGSDDVTATASIDFRCMGSAPVATYSITDDDGLYETGPDANRMRHATLPAEFLPYEMSLSPASGTVNKGVWTPLTITGMVRSTNFRNAAAGNYSDSVVISINP